MTQLLEANQLMTQEIQKKQFMMMGGIIDTKQKVLSPETIKQIEKNYREMYFAFVSINWGMGKTLGVSWQKALEQMDAYVATKMKIAGHPINGELAKIHSVFRRDMAKTIMTNPYVDEILEEDYKKSFFNYGEKELGKAKSFLDNMYQQYMPQQNLDKKSPAKTFEIAKKKAQIFMQHFVQQISQERMAA